MGELYLVITVLNPYAGTIENQAASSFGRVVGVEEGDRGVTYLVQDPSGTDGKSVLRVTIEDLDGVPE